MSNAPSKRTTAKKSKPTAPEDLTPTEASAWSSSSQLDAVPLKVPSGNVALVRNPGMQAFLAAGIIPNSLLAVVQKALQAPNEKAAEKILERGFKVEDADPEKFADVIKLADSVTCRVVVQPKVHPVTWTVEDAAGGHCRPEEIGQDVPYERRRPEVLYVDVVDLEDKMFIFNWAVGGTSDLEAFRGELAGGVGRSGNG